jgi:hypothetical protein
VSSALAWLDGLIGVWGLLIEEVDDENLGEEWIVECHTIMDKMFTILRSQIQPALTSAKTQGWHARSGSSSIESRCCEIG